MTIKNKRKIKLFVDFDGTITQKDVGYHLFSTFLPHDILNENWHEKILGRWRRGEISSRECLTLECRYTDMKEKEVNRELDTIKLATGFKETVEFCESAGIPLMVLSDGLDHYISYILQKQGLGSVEFRANGFHFVNGSYELDFPHADKGCGRCGNCKRWHIENSRSGDDFIIYAGDGYSDRWAVRSVDAIFAKDDLAEYCAKESIDFNPFEDFYDILDFIKTELR